MFYELDELISNHLKYISGPGHVSNQGIQTIDFDLVNKVKDLELHNMHLTNKVDELKWERHDLNNIIHSKQYAARLEFRNNEEHYLEQIDKLKKNNKKLIDELMHVKMILRSPFLYSKYCKAEFKYFPKLELCKYKPKSEMNENNSTSSLLIDEVMKRRSSSQILKSVYSLWYFNTKSNEKSTKSRSRSRPMQFTEQK